ncbi:hypothetical protein [Roseicyclus elongatus]|nr:hypothetical protein [Roseibacterium elongatum]
MAKNTYVATAPDGSQHTRKTDRTYTPRRPARRQGGMEGGRLLRPS